MDIIGEEQKAFFYRNRWFLVPYIVTSLLLIVAYLSFPKENLHMMLNCCHTSWFDTFFSGYTRFIEYVPYVIVIGLFLYRIRFALFFCLSFLTETTLVYFLKHYFNRPRPLLYFSMHHSDFTLPLVNGVRMHSYLSFPSGHTAAFFTFFFCVAVLSPHKYQKFLCFVAALLGGYSRIYLSQHFVEDVIFGSFIGVVSVLCFCLYRFPLRVNSLKKVA